MASPCTPGQSSVSATTFPSASRTCTVLRASSVPWVVSSPPSDSGVAAYAPPGALGPAAAPPASAPAAPPPLHAVAAAPVPLVGQHPAAGAAPGPPGGGGAGRRLLDRVHHIKRWLLLWSIF